MRWTILLEKLFDFIKKIIVGALLLYGFNLITAPLNILIPINMLTVLIVSLLGTQGLCCLILLLIFVF